MKRMQQTSAPKGATLNVSGSINPTKISRGILQTGKGGLHGAKGQEKGRHSDKLRKDMTSRTDEVAPPGWEGTVKAMKKHKEIDNPWALAWYMKNKGYKSHRPEGSKKKESAVGFPTFNEWLNARCR